MSMTKKYRTKTDADDELGVEVDDYGLICEGSEDDPKASWKVKWGRIWTIPFEEENKRFGAVGYESLKARN